MALKFAMQPEKTIEHVRKPQGRGGATRWKKGYCPNPGGRPNIITEVRQLAQQHAPAAIIRLVTLMSSKDERVSVAAASALLDRAVGRPEQALTLGPAPLIPTGDIAPEDAAHMYSQLMACDPGAVDLGDLRFRPALEHAPAASEPE